MQNVVPSSIRMGDVSTGYPCLSVPDVELTNDNLDAIRRMGWP